MAVSRRRQGQSGSTPLASVEGLVLNSVIRSLVKIYCTALSGEGFTAYMSTCLQNQMLLTSGDLKQQIVVLWFRQLV